MFGGYDETTGKAKKDDAVDTFTPTEWMKIGTSFGTVQ